MFLLDWASPTFKSCYRKMSQNAKDFKDIKHGCDIYYMLNLSSFREAFNRDKKLLLNDARDFFLFMVISILGTLIFYKQTHDELISTVILFVLWIFFWKESALRGKVFLVLASVIGYVHELIGVKIGFFTYLGGVFGGVPLWVLPGYGAIFWASYNFWKVFEKSYSQKRWFSYVTYFIIASVMVIFAVDYIFLDLLQKPLIILVEFTIVFMLFRSAREIRLAYFVGLFTVFDEIAGEIIGTWVHQSFSLFSLMSGYVFLLWICLTVTAMLKGTKEWRPIEVIGAIILFAFFGVDVAAKVLA